MVVSFAKNEIDPNFDDGYHIHTLLSHQHMGEQPHILSLFWYKRPPSNRKSQSSEGFVLNEVQTLPDWEFAHGKDMSVSVCSSNTLLKVLDLKPCLTKSALVKLLLRRAASGSFKCYLLMFRAEECLD